MAGGPPGLKSGAEGYQGYVLQPTFGTPVVTPANAKNWVEWTARDLSFDAAQHAVKTAAGKRSTERRAARGMSKTQGGFTTLLEPTAGAALLAYYFGADTYATGTHAIAVTTPRMLTLEKILAGQSLQFQDCFLDTLDLAQSGAEWTAKYGVLGGIGDTPIVGGTPTLPADTAAFQWGQTTLGGAFGGLTEDEMSAITLAFKNGVKQFAGGGSFAPTRARGAEQTASGTMKYLFDSAAAAQAMADYINGTEATVAVTITVDATHNLVITEPNCLMTAHKPVEALAEFVTVDVTWSVLKAELITLALMNDDTAGY